MKNSLISTVVAVTLGVASLSAQAKNSWEDSAKDAWIDGKVESTLLFNGNLNSFDINTDVKEGVVTLTGKVDHEVDKALAGELAMSLDGVTDVNNELTVVEDKEAGKDESSETMTALTDAKIATVVKARLLFESEASGLDIDVSVEQGEVTLEGEVETDAERDLAATIAKNTTDVKNVVNNLSIAS